MLMGITLPLLTMAFNEWKNSIGVSVGQLYFSIPWVPLRVRAWCPSCFCHTGRWTRSFALRPAAISWWQRLQFLRIAGRWSIKNESAKNP